MTDDELLRDPLIAGEPDKVLGWPNGAPLGVWTPGGPSPNPAGRPRVRQDLQELAREKTPEALRTISEIMADEKTPRHLRLRAAELLLDRAWGKPHAVIHTSDVPRDPLSDEELAQRLWFLIESARHAQLEAPQPAIEHTTPTRETTDDPT